MIQIRDHEEYDYATKRGFKPLLDYKHFKMDIRWIWANKPHYCEETLRPLYNYSAVYCSHILTRGAYPEMATDPRNINILCFEAHSRWENGDRERMRIYPGNCMLIDLMKKEYLSLYK